MKRANNEPSLKETDPYKYYKKRYRIFGLIKWLFIILPIAIVLIIYIAKASAGAANTNPISPIKFPIGLALAAVASIVAIISEMRKANKKREEDNTGINFNGAIIWFVIAIVFYFCYISIFYLTVLCFAEFAGQIGACICSYEMKQAREKMKEVEKAEINADAMKRRGISISSSETVKVEPKKVKKAKKVNTVDSEPIE